MPAYARRYKKRKSYRRKRYRRKTNWGGIARQALKTAKWVAGLVNAEYKFVDVNYSLASPVLNTGAMATILTPAQGVSANEREGDSIKTKNILIRGQWQFNPAGGQDEQCRFIVFLDKMNTIATPADFLDSVGTGFATMSNRTESFKFQAKTLYDKTITISSQRPIAQFETVLKPKCHIQFTPGGTTVTTNAIKVLIITQSAVGGSLLTWSYRGSYVDN